MLISTNRVLISSTNRVLISSNRVLISSTNRVLISTNGVKTYGMIRAKEALTRSQ